MDTGLLLGGPLVLIAAIGAVGWLPVGDQMLAAFEQDYGLPASPASRRFVRHYLTMGKRLRRVTFLAVMSIPPYAAVALGGEFRGVGFISTPVVVGLMVATLVVELTLGRPASAAGRRVASLRRRDLGAYLSRTLLWSPAVIGFVAVGTWLAVGASLASAEPGTEWPMPARSDVAWGIGVALANPVLVVLACRWIVRRPQPLVDPELVAADDAIRCSSVRRLAAMGCVVSLFNLAGGFDALRWDPANRFNTAFTAAAALCIGPAAVAWRSRMWGPARQDDAQAPADGRAPTPAGPGV